MSPCPILTGGEASPGIESACVSFRALSDPKPPSSFASLVALPVDNTEDTVMLLSTIVEACEAHVDNCVNAGCPATMRRVCELTHLIDDEDSAALWCRAVYHLSGGPTAGVFFP